MSFTIKQRLKFKQILFYYISRHSSSLQALNFLRASCKLCSLRSSLWYKSAQLGGRNRNTATHKIAVFESEKLSETFVLVKSVVVGNNAFPICRCLVEAKQSDASQRRYFYLGRGGITSAAHFAMVFATFTTGLVFPGIPT